MVMDKPSKKPLLISHRGAHREAPENSCSGFEIALDYGVDGIETDVQLTRDGIPVLFHDATTYRVTGRRKRISAYTCDELKAFDLERAGAREKIPTLAEALELFGSRTSLLIEIKSRRDDRLSGRSQELTDKVIAEIAGLRISIQEKIRILSFDPDVLERTNRFAPRLKCVLNANGGGSWCVTCGDLMGNRVSMEFLSALCLERKELAPDVVKWAHDRGMEMLTYCCNTRPQVERALALGVDGIMTDRPGWLVSTVKILRSEVRGRRPEGEG